MTHLATLRLTVVLLALAACGGDGDLPATGPAPTTLRVRIAPDSTTMARSQQKYFRAMPVTGVIPSGARYSWVVLGGGTLSALAGDSVKYTAPAADGVDTLAVQVLSATNQLIASGATPIRIASGAALSVTLSPRAPHLESQAGAGTQLFIVTPTTGALPAGASYEWTIKGTGAPSGRFNSTSAVTATTTVNNVTYVSPDSTTTDTVVVDVKNASGAVVASAQTTVLVFPGLRWSNSGANALWASNNYANGSYTSPGGGLGRVDVNIAPGVEQISCVYLNKFPVRLAGFQQFNVYIYAPRNVRVQPGNQFVRGASPSQAIGSLDMPQVNGVSSTTLTVTAVETQSDGSDFITYTFATTGNQAGYAGSMSGTGQCVVRYPF